MDQAKKQAFLSRVSRSLGRKELPEFVTPFPYEKGPQYKLYQGATHEEIVEKFKAECDKVGTKYIETTEAQLGEILLAEIQARGGGKVIYPNSAEIEQYKLKEAFATVTDGSAEFVLWDASLGREANILNAQDAQVGITFPILGIAETATIVQPSGVESGRSVGLLPITHIAVLRKDAIVPRMTQSMALLKEAFQADSGDFPSNIVHISGPSNTADIELVRVVGVHGPINVTFILVG